MSNDIIEKKKEKKAYSVFGNTTIAKPLVEEVVCYMATLFSRKQRWVYMDSQDPLIWYYTSMPPENELVPKHAGVLEHRLTVNDMIHVTKYKNTCGIYDTLLTLLPMLKTGVWCFDACSLCSYLSSPNKPNVGYTIEENACFITSRTPKGEEKNTQVCFKITKTHLRVLEGINGNCSSILNNGKHVTSFLLDQTIDGGDILPIDTTWWVGDKRNAYINLPVQAGTNAPNIKGFVTKLNAIHKRLSRPSVNTECTVHCVTEGVSGFVIVEFRIDNMTIMSYAPCVRFFPIHVKENT